MRTRNRFVVGGVGGLAPVLLFLITGDLVQYLIQLDTLRGIGYAARAIALFFVGGFIAYLHTDEDKPFKIFEIGLAAPALLACWRVDDGAACPKQTASRSARNKSRVVDHLGCASLRAIGTCG